MWAGDSVVATPFWTIWGFPFVNCGARSAPEMRSVASRAESYQ